MLVYCNLSNPIFKPQPCLHFLFLRGAAMTILCHATLPFIFSSSSDFPSKYLNLKPLSSHSSFFICRSYKQDLKFALHDALDASGIDTKHARAAREGFYSQIERLSEIERQTSIIINKGVDLGRAALQIAAEDDALVSHSSVPLPVDAFIERLDDLSTDFCALYVPPVGSSPEVFLGNLERFFYVHKGFRRTSVMDHSDTRALYLHSVLTHRSGSVAMLSLIYSEMVKMLRLFGFLDFDAEIYFPHDLVSLPRGYHKKKGKESDQPHIMMTESLLVEMLRNLKDAFWPFQYDNARSLFLKAASAANCVGPSNTGESNESYDNISTLEFASAKAAQHRLGRGVWTSARFGDMRRALAACERLVLLDADSKELRDYSILLYHCGFYEESLRHFKLYQDSRESSPRRYFPPNSLEAEEEDAVEKLMIRLNLVLMEEGWSRPSIAKKLWGNYSEPW